MAKAAKYLGKDDVRVYALLGDGEIAEGQCWKVFLFAAHYRLDNLCVIVDVNDLQIDGPTKQVMNTDPLDEKLRSLGFNIVVADGHDFNAMEGAFDAFHRTTGQPTAIIIRTTKGKGVSFMENSVDWHGKAPNEAKYEVAMAEVRAQLGFAGVQGITQGFA